MITPRERNTMKKFYDTMNTMDTEGIKEAIVATWNRPEGEIFREVGFDILEERLGEEEADAIYSEIYNAAK